MMERVMGIEPTQQAWKAWILPLNYTRKRAFSFISYLTAVPLYQKIIACAISDFDFVDICCTMLLNITKCDRGAYKNEVL